MVTYIRKQEEGGGGWEGGRWVGKGVCGKGGDGWEKVCAGIHVAMWVCLQTNAEYTCIPVQPFPTDK